MSSGFPGGYPEFFNVNGGGVNRIGGGSVPMMSLNNNGNRNGYNPQGIYRSPPAGILADPSQVGARRPDMIGKRSLAEFQQQQAAAYLRNVKPRPYNQQTSPVSPLTPIDLSISSEISSGSIVSSSSLVSVPRYGVPVLPQNAQSFGPGMMISRQHNNQRQLAHVSSPNLVAKQPPGNQETETTVRNQLAELEKQLLLDDDDGENSVVSVITDSEWSETIQKLLGPSQAQKPENTVSPSPTTSSSSSCASSSASPAVTICPKQLISDTATAIMDGKSDVAVEILTRLTQVSNARGTPEQRLSFYMATALRARVAEEQSRPAPDLYGKEHVLSTQLLYDKSPCFKLAFMAANIKILEAVAGSGQPEKKIHVVDFDIGQGVQYIYLLHEIAAARESDKENPISLKLTTFADFGNWGVKRLKLVGDGLKMLSNKLGVCFSFNILNFKLSALNKAVLMVENGEILAVNFAFKLYRLPDESVTTDNLRDEVLRRVKSLSPALMMVIEHEMNANTASFTTRVNDACRYYGALLDSLDSTLARDNPERVRIEEGLCRRMINSVACEGRDRVERCEVFGKWQARMRMAGFEPKPLSQLSAESILLKLNSGTSGNPGFTAKEYSGGMSFGWMGRTLTVASSWH